MILLYMNKLVRFLREVFFLKGRYYNTALKNLGNYMINVLTITQNVCIKNDTGFMGGF